LAQERLGAHAQLPLLLQRHCAMARGVLEGHGALVLAILGAVGLTASVQAFTGLAATSPPPPAAGLEAVAAREARQGLASPAAVLEPQGSSSASLVLAACGVAAGLVAAARGSQAARGRTAMFFQKRYGGGPVKKDPDAEFGPQHYGPPIDYAIQRKARLGMPKGGEGRVIPKLSGGSYECRKAMMRGLTTELIRHGRIKTTLARAQALRFFVDRMIVIAKRGDDLARREAMEWMFDEKLVDNLFKLAPERYAGKGKDFTQVTQTMNRKGDYAKMAYIELV